MIIKIAKKSALKESQITSESFYRDRRKIIQTLGFGAVTAPFASTAHAGLFDIFSSDDDSKKSSSEFQRSILEHSKHASYQSLKPLTPEDKVLRYNNFYEFGSGKGDPYELSQQFKTEPWQLTIDGLVDKPITLNYEDLLTRFDIEERLYRMRCVEAWSMNIPWLGFSLASLIKLASPKSNAKYVRFETLYDPEQFPAQKSRFGGGIDYPYVEGLTIAEAMNPLALLSVGLYGKTLAPQNGAPIRLVVPWKYGFKSIKSIVKITLVDKAPINTWQQIAPREYGFFANVNPQVDHPRWSQGSERFIGEGNALSQVRKDTLMFNGYGEEVASLYKNIDLKRFY